MTRTHAIALLACLALAGGCQRQQDPGKPASADADQTQSVVGRAVGKAMDRAREKIATSNLTLSGNNSLPKAEITPQGEFLVDGSKLPVDDAQRALLLKYRGELLAVAGAGIDIGAQGADFGLRTAGKAVRGALSGDGDKVEAQVEAEAREFEARARTICDKLPALLNAQQQLADRLPAFKPYATMDQSDIDDCRNGD
jgi:hypothetical protein